MKVAQLIAGHGGSHATGSGVLWRLPCQSIAAARLNPAAVASAAVGCNFPAGGDV